MSYRESAKKGVERKGAELICLLFTEIVFKIATGQNLGSDKLTSTGACIVIAICLYGKNLYLYLCFQHERNDT